MSTVTKYKFVGCLIYSFNEKGEEVFLLGQEHPEVGWPDQLKWGMFGGSPESTDQTVWHGAARECYEETSGFIGSYNEILSNLLEIKEIYEFEGTPTFNKSGGSYDFSHSKGAGVFLYPLKYEASLEKKFKDVYEYNHQCMVIGKKGVPKIPSCKKGLFEKIAIKWFTIPEIKSRKEELRRYTYPFFETYIFGNEKIKLEKAVVKKFL